MRIMGAGAIPFLSLGVLAVDLGETVGAVGALEVILVGLVFGGETGVPGFPRAVFVIGLETIVLGVIRGLLGRLALSGEGFVLIIGGGDDAVLPGRIFLFPGNDGGDEDAVWVWLFVFEDDTGEGGVYVFFACDEVKARSLASLSWRDGPEAGVAGLFCTFCLPGAITLEPAVPETLGATGLVTLVGIWASL